MAKIQNISEIHPTLGFTEFDIIEKYRKSFHESELGRLHSVFPFERMAKVMGLSEQRLGRRNIFSPSAKIALMVLKAYTGFSDRQLVEHLNGNIHYQMFCGIQQTQKRESIYMIPKTLPIFMVSGSDDPVGGFGKGVRKIYEKYRAAGIQDVTLRLYAGDRHEILNETDREQVYQDLYEWMQSKMEV